MLRPTPEAALHAVLSSIESVRNTAALYLLMLTFSLSGLLLSMAQRGLGSESPWAVAAWAGIGFFCVFYGTSAAGMVVLDEAQGRPIRPPLQALRDALGQAHRLLLVVLVVLVVALLPLGLVFGLLWTAQWSTQGPAWLTSLGPALAGLAVALGVPLLGLVGLVLVTLVGPISAPSIWAGLSVGQTLAMLLRQVRRRLPHAVMLSAAVSLLTAAVAGLVSFVVLLGGRVLMLLGLGVAGLDLSPQPILAALFGTVWRAVPGAPALSELTHAAISGAGLVFALGLVVPGAVYLRGLCELFLALRQLDELPEATMPATNQYPLDHPAP